MKNLQIVLFLFIVCIGNAQDKISYGLKLGGSYNYDAEMTRNKFGFTGGAFVNLKDSDKFKVQGEILYAKYTAIKSYENVEVTDGTFPGTLGYTANYEVSKNLIQVPIVGQYFFTKALYAEFGPQFAYIFGGKLAFTEDNPDHMNYTFVTEMESQFDFGLTFGLAYGLTDNVHLSLRNYLGTIEKDNILNLSISVNLN
jgi:hypothetical protein